MMNRPRAATAVRASCAMMAAAREAAAWASASTSIVITSLLGLLQMSTKLVPHRGQQLVSVVPIATRTEPLVESRGENRRWNSFVDRSLDRPAAFARVGHTSGELRQVGIFDECRGSQVQQPGRNHAASPPNFRYVSQVEVVLVVLGIAQRRGLGINR